MSFILYFAGAKNTPADTYMLEHGANRLCSQLIDKNNIKNWVENKKPPSRLFIDSGAYTAYTKGVELNVDEYIEYLNSVTDSMEICAQLDTIPGRFNKPKTREEIREAPRLSWENYLYMRERLNEPDKLLPIFHQGEDFKWLKNMLEWTDSKGNHIPYIGVSPAVDVPGLESFLDMSFDIISKSSNPNVKTHAFGMTRLDVLEKYPYTSADSATWKKNAAYGCIHSPWGLIYVGNQTRSGPLNVVKQPKHIQEKLIAYIGECGYTLEEAVAKDTVRYIINLKYYMDWAENYEYKGKLNKVQRLF